MVSRPFKDEEFIIEHRGYRVNYAAGGGRTPLCIAGMLAKNQERSSFQEISHIKNVESNFLDHYHVHLSNSVKASSDFVIQITYAAKTNLILGQNKITLIYASIVYPKEIQNNAAVLFE